MKRFIALILLLIIPVFFIHSDKSLQQRVNEIEKANLENPDLIKWEYVKVKAFDENHIIQKGYHYPVSISLGANTDEKDSLVVEKYIENIKGLLPNLKIDFFENIKTLPPLHFVTLNFNKELENFFIGRFRMRELEDGTTIYRSKPGFIISSDSSKISSIIFNFRDNISDVDREVYIESELWDAIFSTKATETSYNPKFYVQRFNSVKFRYAYGYLGKMDKFLLQKLYADDFLEQFEEYLYGNYPWRYAYSFLHKKNMHLLATGVVSLLGGFVFLLLFSLFHRRRFKNTFLNYFIPVWGIGAFLISFYWLYQYFTKLDFVISWKAEALYLLGAVPILALLSTVILWGTDKLISHKETNLTVQLVQKVFFTLVAFLIPLVIIYFLGEHQDEGLEFFWPQLLLWIGLAIGRGILFYLNHLSDSLVKQKDVELSRLKELNAQSELKLLQSHINPHFLYNSLNSIAGLAHHNADKTEQMALSLSDLFRHSLNKKGDKMSTVQEEVKLVQNYLDIEQIRFGDRLKFTFAVDDTVKEEKIPLFILQPLVENAIKHGVSKIGGKAEVALSIQKDGADLLISVQDNGPDFPDGLVSGHGLQMVYDLLRLSYGDQASLSWENSPKKQIVIRIQKNKLHE